MFSTKFALLGAALIATACTPVVLKTPVSGTPTAVSRLVGDWQGDYTGGESGRRGVITFRLRAGADTAEGDVIMQSRTDADPSAPNAPPVGWESLRTTHEPLSIRFVFVSDSVVTGVLNPYRDPECGCALTTTFRGTLRGDAMEGTFHSEGSSISHIPTDGRWRVKRYAP